MYLKCSTKEYILSKVIISLALEMIVRLSLKMKNFKSSVNQIVYTTISLQREHLNRMVLRKGKIEASKRWLGP